MSNTTKPTTLWRERMDDGDEIFTEEIIQETDILLNKFSKELSKKSVSGNQKAIMTAVQQLVEALNELGGMDGELGTFIETMEREELWAFIDQSARSRTQNTKREGYYRTVAGVVTGRERDRTSQNVVRESKKN